MRHTTFAVAALLLAAGPALAGDAGNVGQPSRAVPQTGQTTGGPRDTMPGSGGSMATGSVSRPAGEMGMSPSAGAVESAKGGNASEPNKPVPNLGGTAGGPAR